MCIRQDRECGLTCYAAMSNSAEYLGVDSRGYLCNKTVHYYQRGGVL